MYRLLCSLPNLRFGVWSPEYSSFGLGGTLQDGSIVGVSGDSPLGILLVCVADHVEKGKLLTVTVNSEVGIELLMPAMLRVDLCKHEEFNIVGVAGNWPALGECGKKVINFGGVECQTEGLVGSFQFSSGVG